MSEEFSQTMEKLESGLGRDPVLGLLAVSHNELFSGFFWIVCWLREKLQREQDGFVFECRRLNQWLEIARCCSSWIVQ